MKQSAAEACCDQESLPQESTDGGRVLGLERVEERLPSAGVQARAHYEMVASMITGVGWLGWPLAHSQILAAHDHEDSKLLYPQLAPVQRHSP